MKILQRWNEYNDFARILKIAILLAIQIIIWLASFYVSVTFNAAWRKMNNPWLLGYLFCFILDIVILEILTEGFIALLFSKRKDYTTVK